MNVDPLVAFACDSMLETAEDGALVQPIYFGTGADDNDRRRTRATSSETKGSLTTPLVT